MTDDFNIPGDHHNEDCPKYRKPESGGIKAMILYNSNGDILPVFGNITDEFIKQAQELTGIENMKLPESFIKKQ